ncbi:MAG: hypothetical protein DWI58_20180 [Chloroflexi bacterium]|nr:MAG: hypothetical protein DWI58_20180 [Chloroflexota bacterium]
MAPETPKRTPVRVVIEAGAKRVFATAIDWPGWSRSGRDEAGAIEALAAYADRYRAVVTAAKVRFPAHPAFKVIERVRGNGATDFGVPGQVTKADHEPPTLAEAKRLAALVEGGWAVFDAIAAAAPATLRKGPGGGGRDGDEVVQHVLSAESASYARSLGLRLDEPRVGARKAIETSRAAIAEAIRAGGRKDALETKWPVRYAASRIAWHVLDHAWEIEDKSER